MNIADSERTVTIKLATENTSEWVQEYSGDNHTNTASLDVNGQVVTDTAVSNPKSEGVAKTGNYEGTIIINGREYPVFKYTLNLYGVSDASFDNNGKLTLTDEYNGEYLKLLVKSTDEDWGELRWSWANKNNAYQGGRTTWTDINGLLTITADKNEFVLDGNGLYSPVYQIYYYLIVKDETTLDTLERVSINATDHKVPIENTVTWGDFHDEVTIDYEYPGVDKEQLGHADSKGMVKYKIVLNPDKQTLNNGEPMEMQDSATNITVDYSTIQIKTDPAADITYYYRGYTGYYTIPDRTKVTITYSARVIGDGEVPISNDAVMKGFKDSTSSTETGDSSGSGNLNIDWVVVYKHEWRKMDKGLNDAVYVLTDEDGNPILYPTTAKNGLVGQPVTFTTGNIDLNALPDGTRLAEETNYRDGYAWLYLDKDQTGLAFQKGITYYFKEYEAPPGYQKDDTIFTFTISEHPDYDDWEYHKGDILRLADSEVEGNLEISKTFVGAENLTDTQKQQITFKITAVDNTGAPMKIPYTKDTDGNNVYSDETGLEITYADFENGVYKLEALPDGIYTVIETNAELGGYTHTSTTYLVDGENGNEDDYSGTITISDSTKHTVAYTNNYEPEGAHITVLKKDDSRQISLYGATFQLYKKNSGGTYEVVTDHDGLTSNGEFTIDYDNRENGVTITKLVPGDYYIKETKAPADYQLDETPFYFTVHEHNEKVTGGTHGANVTFENAPNGKNLVATVTDKISHTYTLTKVDALKLSKKLNGAEFTVAELTGFNSEGAVVTSDTNYWTFTTGEDGTIVIDADALDLLTNKVYVIWETKAPEGYEQSNKIYAFYTGEQSAVSTQLIQLRSGYPDASIVSLANGPQKTSVPNTERSMDLSVKKVWHKTDGTKLSDLPPESWGITEIEVKLYQQVYNSDGTLKETKQYPDENTTFKLTKMGDGVNNSWFDYKWEDLPTGDSVNTANPLSYKYYVEEVIPEGFEAHYGLITTIQNEISNFNSDGCETDASAISVGADSEKKSIEIMNSMQPISMRVQKVWIDDGEQRPDSIVVNLRYRDNANTEIPPTTADLNGVSPDQTLNSANGWSFSWDSMNPGEPGNLRTYYIKEGNQDVLSQRGYVGVVSDPDENGNVVITNTKTTSDKLKVKKVWLNADGTMLTDESQMEPVTVQLQKEVGTVGPGHTVTVKRWTNYWQWQSETSTIEVADGSDLTINFDSSANQVYQGEPEDNSSPINNRYLSYNSIHNDFTVNVWVLPSNYLNCSFSNYTVPQPSWSGEISDVTVEDGIKMNNNSLTNDQILITLDGIADSNETTAWTYIWDNLTAPDGKAYRYSVREVEVPAGFNVSYENNDGIQTGVMYVKNTVSEYTRALARKVWLNSDGNPMTKPPENAEVTFALYQNGKLMSKKITLDGTVDGSDEEGGEREPWVTIWEGLERKDANGEEYEYTIKEFTGFTGYTAMKLDGSDYVVMEASDSIASGETIYNKKSRTLTVTKVWQDEKGDPLTDIPEGTTVTIGLYKSGETEAVKTIVLDGRVDVNGESPAWVANFTGLEDSATYTVKEEGMPSGFTLVRTQLNSDQPVTENVSAEVTLATGDNTVIYTNKKEEEETGSLSITKNVTVNNQSTTTKLADGAYVFSIAGPDSGTVVKYVQITVTNGKAVSYKVADGPDAPDDWTSVAVAGTFASDATNREAVVSDLAAGDYTITETEVSGMTTTVSGGKENKDKETANTITVTVTAGENVDATAKATFTNNKTPMTSFNFNKIWLGPTGNVATPTSYQDWQEDITVTIKRKAGASGAEDDNFALKYTISKSEDTFTATMDTSASKLPTVEGELNALTLTDSGTDNVFNFKLREESLRKYNDDGTEWEYYVVEDEVALYVTSYGTATTGDSGTSYSVTPGASDAKDGGVIVNQTFGGYELPSTGGPGTRIFSIFGSILILGAGVLLWRRRRLI